MAKTGRPRPVSGLDVGQTAARSPVTVNGTEIKRAAIAREAQHHPSASPGEATQRAAEALVLREILLQEARRRQLPAAPEVDERGRHETDDDALINALIRSVIKTPEPTQDEIARYYGANKARFRSPDLFEASHILIAARRDDQAAFAAAQTKAQALAADLADCPANFFGMAQVFSDCPSAREGGSLGQVSASEVTPEFAEALTKLAEGEVTREPVETRYGCHIIRLERCWPGKVLPLATVSGRIAAYLTERSERTAIAQFVARLVSAAKIYGIVLADAETHRVF